MPSRLNTVKFRWIKLYFSEVLKSAQGNIFSLVLNILKDQHYISAILLCLELILTIF